MMTKMRLEVREYPVGDIEFGSKTYLDGTRLVVNLADLEALAKEETALAGIEGAVARPGEPVRIIHVLDAVEGMCKVEGPSTVYPGFLGPPITAGRGITNKLTGMLIMSTTEFPQPMPGGLAFREGVIDMMGPGQPYCQASHVINLVIRYLPTMGVSNQELDDAVRLTTLRIARYLASTTRGLPPAERHVWELSPVSAEFPRVAYIDQIMNQTLMTQTFLYGKDLEDTLPTLIHPNELIDGAIVTGNYKNSQKIATYLHCNKPAMMELYRRHGVDLNFVGMVINRGHRDNQMLKHRGAEYSAKLALLAGAQGVVVTFEGGGNATMDFMLTVKACEQLGIRTVASMYEHAEVGSGEFPIVYHVPEADALVSVGAQGETFTAPKVDRLLGGSPRLVLYSGGIIEDATQSFQASSTDYWGMEWQLGESGFRAREY
jgi:sarcosine reductase